ncbi:pirin family protein [Cryptosporangium sp. NPDC048952]|uniref:pirin family protein n=1 Tax=Cryptosporangium sp. NPDC048952 TaxID=3363961 RepID=UPI00371554BD
MQSKIDVRRSASRDRTETEWLDSRHSFSFGVHYQPDNTHHGLLVVHNDDVVRPGAGFDTHPHRDMEIVTWVLEGSLAHADSMGNSGVIHPGLAQRMSAGRGVLHSEKNDSAEPVRFVQAWVTPDEAGIDPGYEQADIASELLTGELTPVASGLPRHAAAVRIKQKDAALSAARLRPGTSVQLPDAPYLHVFVASGAVELENAGLLAQGDAVRATAAGGLRVTTGEPAEILVWEMHTTLGERS